jgi:hypothetical protein
MNNPFHALFKQGRLDREIASNIVRHLLEQDGKDRDLQREFARYQIERDKKENLYRKALSLILLFSGLGGLFAFYCTKGTELHTDRIYLWVSIVLLGAAFILEYMKIPSNKRCPLPNPLPDNKNLDTQWEKFFELMNEARQDTLCPPFIYL